MADVREASGFSSFCVLTYHGLVVLAVGSARTASGVRRRP